MLRIGVEQRELHLGVARLEGGQQAGQHVLGQCGASSQAQAAGGFVGVAQGVELVFELLGGGGHGFGVGLQQPASFGEGHAVAAPRQQALAVLGFQLPNVLGDGRLRDKQPLRGFGEAQVLGHGLEYAKAKIGHAAKVQATAATSQLQRFPD